MRTKEDIQAKIDLLCKRYEKVRQRHDDMNHWDTGLDEAKEIIQSEQDLLLEIKTLRWVKNGEGTE